MVVRNHYVPTEVTDFAGPLTKIYERQSRQTQQWLENQLEWSSQVEAADGGKTALATAQKFLQTAGQVGSAVSTFKANQKKSEDKKQEKTNAKLAALVDTKGEKLAVEEFAKYRQGTSEIIKNDIDLKNHLIDQRKKGYTINPKLEKLLLERSAGEGLRIQEWQIGRLVITGPEAFKTWEGSLEGAEKEKWAKYTTDNPDANHYLQFFRDHYAPSFGVVSPEAIGALIAPETQRAARTHKGSANTSFRSNMLTERASAFSDRIDNARNIMTANGQGGTELSSLTQSRFLEIKGSKLNELNLKEGVKATEEQISWANNYAKQQLGNELYALARTGKLTFAEFQGLKNGNIIDHPSGDTAEIILDQKQWNRIEAGVSEASQISINNQIAGAKQNLINADAAYRKGEGSLKDVNNAQDAFISVGGDMNDKAYKSSLNFDQFNNSESVYNQERKPFEMYLTGHKRGSLGNDQGMLAQINAIKNDKLKRELLAQYNKETKLLETVKFPDRVASTKEVKSLIIDQGLNQTLKIDSELTGELVHMVDEIVDKRNWFLMNQDPNDPYAKEKSDKQWRDWLTSEGFFSKGREEDPTYGGKFTPNKNGEYKHYAPIRYGQIEATKKTTSKDLLEYNINLNKALLAASKKPGKTVLDTALDTSESILTREDIIGSLKTPTEGQPIFISEEVKIKAHSLGIQPSVLLRRQAEALIASLDSKDPLLKTLNLKELLKQIPTGDVEVRDALAKDQNLVELNNGSLTYAWEFLGPEAMSPQVINRTYQALIGLDATREKVSSELSLTKKEQKEKIKEEVIEKWSPPESYEGDAITNTYPSA